MGTLKDGIYLDSQGIPAHRGVVTFDGKIYYAGHNGVLVKDQYKTIHHGMANGLLKHGIYYFDADGVCDLKSYRPSKESRSKVQKWFRRFKRDLSDAQIILISVALLLVIGAAMFFIVTQWIFPQETSTVSADDQNDQQGITITLPTFEDEVYLCSATMKKYYQGQCTLQEVVASGASAYQPLVFRYGIRNATSASLLLSESKEYTDSVSYDLNPNGTSVTIDNLKTGITYYYLVTALDADGNQTSEGGEFTTARTNRFLTLSGVYNTRDIGGYDTLYGKRVKQGLLIRGTELDGLVQSGYYLKDVSEIEPFGFVCDFDLRNSDIFNTTYISRLGENVVHKFHNSPMYGGIFAKGNAPALKEIFSELANANNYPMYFHCTLGADRTGTVVFLLQGLLGVSEEDMVREYQLTGFFNKDYATTDAIQSVISGLQGVPGSTINEKIEHYMVDTVGLTQAQIQSLRDIFLE